jgi:uncharacterized membrane-anchored protein YjiN (DUF445 family)
LPRRVPLARWQTGMRWWRFFAIRSGCQSPARRSFRRTRTASARAWPTLLLKLNVSRISGKALAVLIEDNRHQALLDRGLSALEEWLMANQGLVKAKFSQASRYTPVFLDNYVVEKFIDGICALLHEVAANPRHELRVQFDGAIQELIERLQTSLEYRQNGDTVLREFVEHLRSEN